MNDLPKRLKVAAIDFEILTWDQSHADDLKMWGKTTFSEQRIQIDTHMGGRRSACTLLHEIIHCVFRQWEIAAKEDSEERIVSTLENGLAAVWRDNPEVFAWIHTQVTTDSASAKREEES